jgi:hypothetical protein
LNVICHPEVPLRSNGLEGRRPSDGCHPSRLATLALQDDGAK